MSDDTPSAAVITSDMLFVVSAQGDGCHSLMVSGQDELREAVCACLWVGSEQTAPPDVVEILTTLNDPDEWSGSLPFFAWGRHFEDGSVSVQRIIAPVTLAARLIAEKDAEIATLRERLEWRPIETAPKDGTFVLTCIAGTVIPYVAAFDEDDDDPLWFSFNRAYESGRRDGRKYEPTHWQPMPDPRTTPAPKESTSE